MSAQEQAVTVQDNGALQYIPPNPLAMLAAAVERGADADTLTKLLDLRDRLEKDAAKKAYIAAKAEFKSKHIVVTKDKENKQYTSRYTSLGNLVQTVTPFLSECGLEASWNIDQSNGIKVTCTLTHIAGHSESTAMVCPPDKSGSKNPIQEIKSAITYAKACTFESVCGLASTDANVDDDGNGAFGGEYDEHIEWIANACDMKELQRLYANAYKQAASAKDVRAMKSIVAAKDARKAELCA